MFRNHLSFPEGNIIVKILVALIEEGWDASSEKISKKYELSAYPRAER